MQAVYRIVVGRLISVEPRLGLWYKPRSFFRRESMALKKRICRVAGRLMNLPAGLTIPILCLVFTGISAAEIRNDAPEELRTRTFQLTYQVSISEIPVDTEHLEAWLPYPQSDQNQEIFDITIDSPAVATVYTEPVYGNAVLYISIRNPERSSHDLKIEFKVRRREYLRNDFESADKEATGSLDSEVEKFLRPARLVPITNEVKQWATEVTRHKSTDLDKARAIYDYAISILKYDKSGEGWGRGDLLYACDAKRGNCTDFHALFTGFSRAVGIPARFSIGLPLPSRRGEGEIAGYHCWAEFYLQGYGWVPVDASEGWKQPERKDYFFGAHDENRVQLSVGRDIVLRPHPQSGPLNYFVYPHVEADGEPFQETVLSKFYFRDLPE
jgi:transglutaminase-like putative cysteine protease